MNLSGRLVTDPHLRGRLAASQGGGMVPDGSVTTAIARGEAITIGTNATKTSVAAEIAALS